MRVIETISDMKAVIRSQKRAGKSIGFVPTMGYLHEGHLALAKRSIQENEFTVMSIFVNPTQFGPKEDFSKYPRDMARDCRMAEEAGIDMIFAPTVEEMYPSHYKSYIIVEDITEILCGASRPGHFKGVATVVAKLVNIIEADKAYFGQKDAQQAIVIQKMVKDLNMNVEIITCPIVREADGLAMSSRNVYLSPEQRKAALILSKTLFEAEELVENGETDKEKVVEYIKKRIMAEPLASIEYVEALDADTLEARGQFKCRMLVALAARFGTTRLIDNIIVEV
jgi:pantoate--beta-alanine ligase